MRLLKSGFFSIALSALLVFCLFPASAFAEGSLMPSGGDLSSKLVAPQANESGKYAISVTPKLNSAALDYMTDMYIKEYPEMGREIMFGTTKDIATLKKLGDKIVSGVSGDAAKCKQIAQWTKRNITYVSHHPCEPIDTFALREGNCFSYAYFMQHLMRIEGIPAVVCSGYRGDMANVVTVQEIKDRSIGDGHAWVLAYCSGQWRLYDPLFDVYGSANKAFLDQWYFTMDMEGVAPYYEGMDLTMCGEICVYRINGKMMGYANGQPGYLTYGDAWDYTARLGNLDFGGLTRYYDSDGVTDGWSYVDDPGRENSMVVDELYTNGLITDGNDYRYARPNGMLVRCTTRQLNGKWYYLEDNGVYLSISKDESKLSLSFGRIELVAGQSIRLLPTWFPYSDDSEEHQYSFWTYCDMSIDPQLISVDQTGLITAKKVSEEQDAFALCVVLSHDEDGKDLDQRTRWQTTQAPVYVANKAKSFDYSDDLTSASVSLSATASAYTGKAIKPSAVVKLGGKTLKAGVDYVLSYKNNVKVGNAVVTVKGKGDYKGTKTLAFKITKAMNPMNVVTKRSPTVNYNKSKAVVVKAANAYNFKKKAVGTVTYARVAKGSSKWLTVNSKTGDITVKAGAPKGKVQAVVVKVSAKGNANYKTASKTLTVKVKVK